MKIGFIQWIEIKNALYRHSRAGGNPDRRITTLSYQCLTTQTLDSRLRGNDDTGRSYFNRLKTATLPIHDK